VQLLFAGMGFPELIAEIFIGLLETLAMTEVVAPGLADVEPAAVSAMNPPYACSHSGQTLPSQPDEEPSPAGFVLRPSDDQAPLR